MIKFAFFMGGYAYCLFLNFCQGWKITFNILHKIYTSTYIQPQPFPGIKMVPEKNQQPENEVQSSLCVSLLARPGNSSSQFLNSRCF